MRVRDTAGCLTILWLFWIVLTVGEAMNSKHINVRFYLLEIYPIAGR
jgi:hypothetical protein